MAAVTGSGLTAYGWIQVDPNACPDGCSNCGGCSHLRCTTHENYCHCPQPDPNTDFRPTGGATA